MLFKTKENYENLFFGVFAWLVFFCLNIKLFPNFVKQINMILISLMIVYSLINIKRILADNLIYLTGLALLLFYCFIQLLTGKNSSYSLASVVFIYLICPMIPLVFASFAIDGMKVSISKIMKVLIFVDIAVSICAVYEFFSKDYILSSNNASNALKTIKGGTKYLRASVFSSSYLVLGDFLGLGFLYSLKKYLEKENPVYLFAGFVLFSGICVTLSRGPIISCLISSLLMLALTEQGFKKLFTKQFLVFACILLVSCACILVFYENSFLNIIIDRIVSSFDWSMTSSGNNGRIRHWSFYWQLFTSSPKNLLFGIGISQAAYGNSLKSVTESGLLQNLVELGIIGSSLYYYVLLFPVCKFLIIKKSDRTDNMIYCFCVLLMFLIHDLVLQVSISVDCRIIIWIISGFLFYYTYYGKALNGFNSNSDL